MPIPALVGALAPLLGKVLDRAIPDPVERERVKQQAMAGLLAFEGRELAAAAGVIAAEAGGESWLQRNWRPLLMCVFGLIVFNNYVLAPYLEALVSFSVTLAIPPAMWDLLKLGIGGYIVGRSAEKAVRAWRGGE
jgi:hypothetical protein